MDEPNALNWDNVRNVVEEWFLKLQYERKCNSTNTVSKIVHHSTEEIQENIRKLISNKINIEIERCLKSKDIEDMQKTCNVINGCFDNFVHAVDGVRNSFEKVISFVDFGIDECQLKFLEW